MAKSQTTVPPFVLATVKRAISLRKRCTAWFSSSRGTAGVSDQKHSHFIKVLEDLCERLEWRSPKHSTMSSSQDPSNDILDRVKDQSVATNNSFAVLSLGETENAEDNATAQFSPSEQRLVDIVRGRTTMSTLICSSTYSVISKTYRTCGNSCRTL